MESQTTLHAAAIRRLEEMLESVKEACGRSQVVMIVDLYSIRVLSSIVSVLDLTSRGVTVIEKLELKRKPFPDLDALYFITPEDTVLQKLIEDWSEEKPIYRSANLCFTSRIPDSYLDAIAGNAVGSYVTSLKEVNCDVRMVGSNVFSCDIAGKYHTIFQRGMEIEKIALYNRMGAQVSNALTLLNELPFICYHKGSLPGRELSEKINEHLQRIYRSANIQFNQQRATLIILDRSCDVAAPLMHDTHYEAMLKDIVKLAPDGSIEYESTEGSIKKAVINEQDEIFKKYRYKEITEGFDKLKSDFDRFRADNTAVEAAGRNEQQSLPTLAKVVQSLPTYNDYISKYWLHISLSNKCMKRFQENNVTAISELEQIIMTGVDVNGDKVTCREMLSRLKKLLPQILSPMDRARLCMMIPAYIDLSEKDRRAMTEFLDSNGMNAYQRLYYLGVNPQSQKTKSQTRFTKEYRQEMSRRVQASTTKFSYAKLKLSEFLDRIVNRTLEEEFTFVGGHPEYHSDMQSSMQVIGLRNRKAPGAEVRAKERYIVFVIGGLSYNELSLIESYPSIQLIMGGSRVMTPEDFLQEMYYFGQEPGSMSGRDNIDSREIAIEIHDYR